MNRFEENGLGASGAAEPTRTALDQRIRDLEEENRQLRTDLDTSRHDAEFARKELDWYHVLGLPVSETEMLERAKTGPTISDVIAECEREFGK